MGSMAIIIIRRIALSRSIGKSTLDCVQGCILGKLRDGSSEMMAFTFCSKLWTIALMNSLWVFGKSKSSAMVIP